MDAHCMHMNEQWNESALLGQNHGNTTRKMMCREDPVISSSSFLPESISREEDLMTFWAIHVCERDRDFFRIRLELIFYVQSTVSFSAFVIRPMRQRRMKKQQASNE